MALYQDLPVFADIYALTHKVFLYTQDYPREYKFTLGQDMKRDCLVLLRSIYQINKSSDKVAQWKDMDMWVRPIRYVQLQ